MEEAMTKLKVNDKIQNQDKLITHLLYKNTLIDKLSKEKKTLELHQPSQIINHRSNTEVKINGETISCHKNNFSILETEDELIKGGRVTNIQFARRYIPCKMLATHSEKQNFEGIFFEINLRNKKWLMLGGYNPQKKDRCDNMLIFGDFNSQLKKTDMQKFCDLYSLKNLINESTWFKNPNNPNNPSNPSIIE